jgi:hypothetical protein
MPSVKSLLTAHHSKAVIDRINDYIGYDETLFEELLAVFLGDDEELARQAAWVFSDVAPRFPKRCHQKWQELLALANRPSTHDAIKRGFFRALQHVDPPEAYLGETIQLCFDQLLNRQAAIAIRVFAMTGLVNMVQPLPELKTEIRLLLEDELPYASAGFVSRARREMRRL